MFTPEMIDIVRYLHLLFVVLGLGAAFLADVQVLQNLKRPVSRELLLQLLLCHRFVWGGVFGMWVTGVALIYIRTGFDLAEFTPKLMSKMAVVSILTINAWLIGRFALPLLYKGIGEPPTAMPLKQKIQGGWLASLSSASWLMALALGSSKVLAVSDWSVFMILIPGVYAVMVGGSTFVVLTMHVGTYLHERFYLGQERIQSGAY